MLQKILFLIVVLVTNIIQGITGFAGTVLAMPPSVLLVGFETAKPILNVLGIFAGVYVVVTSYRYVNKKEFLKCISVMLVGIVAGIFLRSLFTGNPSLLYKVLGAIVIAVGLFGCYKLFIKKSSEPVKQNPVLSYALLIGSGIVHGMFVCGGPLLVSYLTGKLPEKKEFRATVSAIWVVLNTIILFSDIKAGYFNTKLFILLGISIAVLFGAMFLGSVILKHINKKWFMITTYVLMGISGLSLILK